MTARWAVRAATGPPAGGCRRQPTGGVSYRRKHTPSDLAALGHLPHRGRQEFPDACGIGGRVNAPLRRIRKTYVILSEGRSPKSKDLRTKLTSALAVVRRSFDSLRSLRMTVSVVGPSYFYVPLSRDTNTQKGPQLLLRSSSSIIIPLVRVFAV